MTEQDFVYADWLDLFGSETVEPPDVEAALHRMHERAEASHGQEDPA